MSKLYEKIEMLCKEHKESITTMCKASGASRGSLSDLKMGRISGLNIGTLTKIADHFGVSVDYFLDKPERNPLVVHTMIDDELMSGVAERALWTVRQMQKEKPAGQKADEHRDPLMEPEVLFALFGGADNITPEMIKDVKRFARYVQQEKAKQEK